MAEHVSKDIRIVIAVGHAGSGKTTLLDQMLFKASEVTRAGSALSMRPFSARIATPCASLCSAPAEGTPEILA